MSIKNRLFPLLLAVLLCTAMVLPAHADAWLPPADDNVNWNIIDYIYQDQSCRALNVFLSNYCEANISFYSSSSPDSVAINGLLKHFELNPLAYPGAVWQETLSNGKTYMAISGSQFETSMRALYNRSVSAASVPGYLNGTIYVTASDYNQGVSEFASAMSGGYMGDNTYTVYFRVLRAHSGFDRKYTCAYHNLPSNQVTDIGDGMATFRYDGGTDTTEFSPRDFVLIEYEQSASGISHTNSNLPYSGAATDVTSATQPSVAETTPAVTAAPPKAETTPTEATAAPTTLPPETAAPSIPSTESDKGDFATYPGDATPTSTGGINTTALIIVIAVVAVAAIVLVVVLVAWRKPRPTQPPANQNWPASPPPRYPQERQQYPAPRNPQSYQPPQNQQRYPAPPNQQRNPNSQDQQSRHNPGDL